MNARGSWQGMWTIARLNWAFYAAALVVLLAALFALPFFTTAWAQVASGLAALASAYFLIVSLGVSHLVYDRSELYRFNWLDRALRGTSPVAAVYCHAGFDERSGTAKEKLPGTRWTILDHYDELRMTEPSIRRARRLFPPVTGTLAAPHHAWPLPAQAVDLILGFLAIHEFRTEAARIAWFAEARRCLRPGGLVLLVEHVRDFANFLAFGPGFLHFHSPANWRGCWEAGGLKAVDEFRVTPWVRIFVLSPV
jgi:SAM-dependent methyltransferase